MVKKKRLREMETGNQMEQSDDQFRDDELDALMESEIMEAILEAENT